MVEGMRECDLTRDTLGRFVPGQRRENYLRMAVESRLMRHR